MVLIRGSSRSVGPGDGLSRYKLWQLNVQASFQSAVSWISTVMYQEAKQTLVTWCFGSWLLVFCSLVYGSR